jgi:hypothetical protein
MAYATAEDRAFFKQIGWVQDDNNMQFHDPGIGKFISANWFGKRPANLDVPSPEAVIWIAISLDPDANMMFAVDQEQQCQGPVTAYALAELKQWRA